MSYFRAAIAGVLGSLLVATVAGAQARIDAHKDWSAFKMGEGDGRQCWIVSTPTAKRAVRGGQAVSVKRGEIYLMVAVRPGDDVVNEVSFLSGYPFRKGSTVTVKIGSTDYRMFTEKETAWARSREDDAKMVAAMRRGAEARIEGVSTRGTATYDTFSLSGFTAALKSASDTCK